MVLEHLAAGDDGVEFLPHKTRPPLASSLISRPRLIELVGSRQVVALVAPSGYGKSCLALALAEASPGPTAWYTADDTDVDSGAVTGYLAHALARAWPDLAAEVPAAGREQGGGALLAYLLSELAGPGCLVIDDAHALPRDVIEDVISIIDANRQSNLRLIVCTRGPLLLPLLGAEAEGRGVTLDASQLGFDRDEIARLLSGLELDVDEMQASTGGWPLALGLASSRTALGTDPFTGFHRVRLADAALSGLTAEARSFLALISRLPGVPVPAVLELLDVEARTEVERYVEANPSLVQTTEDGWWRVRDLIRDVLGHEAVIPSRAVALADRLLSAGEPVQALHLLAREAQWTAYRRALEAVVPSLIETGRWRVVRDAYRLLPEGERTPVLRLADANAAFELNWLDADAGQSPGYIDADQLEALVDQMRLVGEAEALRASAILVLFYVRDGDPRAIPTAVAALETMVPDLDDGEGISYAVRAAGADVAMSLAMLLLSLGMSLLFCGSRQALQRSRTLLEAAFRAYRFLGQDPTPLQGMAAFYRATIYAEPAGEALGQLEAAVAWLQERDHPFAAHRLCELGLLQLDLGDLDAAEHHANIALDLCARRGSAVLTPVRALLFAVAILRAGSASTTPADGEEIWCSLRTDQRVRQFSPYFAALFGQCLADVSAYGDAEVWLARGREAVGGQLQGLLLAPYLDLLELRLLVARGDAAAAGTLAQELIDGAHYAGLDSAVPMIMASVAAELARHGRPEAASTLLETDLEPRWMRLLRASLGQVDSTTQAMRLDLRFLGDEITCLRNGVLMRPPTGFAAKLLAYLVASRGTAEVDAAIEVLWPGADPDAGRNRLHGVLLRLRRMLGLPSDGPIECSDGLIRLRESPTLDVDAWEFQRIVAGTAGHDLEHAARLYRGEFCAKQFAYEDFAIDYRRVLRGQYQHAAREALGAGLEQSRAGELADVARTAWRLNRDDDELCLLVTEVLAASGRRGEAGEVVSGTAEALEGLGVPTEDFRRRGQDLLARLFVEEKGVAHSPLSPPARRDLAG